ncbi:MAG: hypothetical protein IT448_10265 [Phycisphaerales bacterium]|nr:hypothetical protein [Phycisphaerales bacterium]
MIPSEQNLEELQAYLDDQLTPDQRAALDQRLANDPVLVEVLDALHADRADRAALWRSLEPNESQIQHLIDSIDQRIRRESVWQKRASALRWVSAAAASVLLGLGIGWFAHQASAPGPTHDSHWLAKTPTSVQEVGTGPGGGSVVRSTGDARSLPHIQNTGPANMVSPAETGGEIRVALTDESGNVLAVQPFDSIERARAFTNDLQQWQQRQRQAQDGALRLVGDRF